MSSYDTTSEGTPVSAQSFATLTEEQLGPLRGVGFGGEIGITHDVENGDSALLIRLSTNDDLDVTLPGIEDVMPNVTVQRTDQPASFSGYHLQVATYSQLDDMAELTAKELARGAYHTVLDLFVDVKGGRHWLNEESPDTWDKEARSALGDALLSAFTQAVCALPFFATRGPNGSLQEIQSNENSRRADSAEVFRSYDEWMEVHGCPGPIEEGEVAYRAFFEEVLQPNLRRLVYEDPTASGTTVLGLRASAMEYIQELVQGVKEDWEVMASRSRREGWTTMASM